MEKIRHKLYFSQNNNNNQGLTAMSKGMPFAEQSREQVTRSVVNRSTAKTLWSFSKGERFSKQKPSCPYSSYDYNLSTITKVHAGFGSSQRRVFTETSDAPSSWNYNPAKPSGYRPLTAFGLPRDRCVSGTYIPIQKLKNPGPGQYVDSIEDRRHGYSMRPRTAHEKNYFIDNKELKFVPSPFDYNVRTDKAGVATVSKFRTVTMGNTLQSRNSRFQNPSFITPSPNLYRPNKSGINKYSKNGKIGSTARRSFIDEVTKTEFTPGPGNYRVPTQFAHYSAPKKSRFSVA